MKLAENSTAGLGKQITRYLATGGLNTLLGLAVIWALLSAGVSDVPANAIGYAAGLLVSFMVNRSWTFGQASAPTLREAIRFAGAFGIAYGVNLAVLLVGLRLGLAGNPFLHLSAVIAYSTVGFVLTRMLYAAETQSGVVPSLNSTALLLILVVAACLVIPGMPITHDVVWQFWVARQMNNGIELYAQINEVNPPLWFWMAMPIDRLGTWLSINPIILVQLAIIALAALCFTLSSRLLTDLAKPQKLFFLANAFALGLVIAWGNFAQREQIAMIVALPYTLTIVKRAQGQTLPPGLALGIGLLAASGIALKHYFVAVPALLELWLLIVLRWRYRPFRPEALALCATAFLYALAVWQFAPAFLTHQLPMVFAAYDGYSNPFFAMIDDREQVLWISCIIVFIACGWMKREYFTPLTIGLCITTAGFLFSYAAQKKGWVYHSMPVTYFLLLALIATALNSYNKRDGRTRYALPALALAMGYLFPISFGPYNSRYAAATNEAIAGTPAGSSIFTLSSAAQRSWPMIVENGYVWPSRFMSLWMLPGIVSGARDDQRLAQISDEIRAATVIDLQCTPPYTILVERIPINRLLRSVKFDYIGYFTENIDAKILMDQYELVKTTQSFFVYHRKSKTTTTSTSKCREIY